MFVALLFLLMVTAVAFSCLRDERPVTRILVYAGIAAAITLMAGLRPLGIDKDSLQYYSYYLGNFDDMVEPTFIFISETVRATLGDVQGIFIVYALLAIPLKCFVFTRLSKEYFLLLAVYMSHFLILHDMTQIRVGAAVAFIILGFYFMVQRRRWLTAVLFAIAVFFHITAILAFLMLLFRNNDMKIWHRVVLAFAPCMAFASVLYNIDFISLIPFGFVQDKLMLYEEIKDKGLADVEQINIFNAAIMLKMMVYYVLLWKYDEVKAHCPYITLLLKIFALSYICLGVFNFIAVYAARISELFGFVEILMVPLLIHIIRPVWAARLLILIYVCGIFLIDVLYTQLLQI